MFRKLISAAVALTVALGPMVLAPTALAAVAQAGAAPTDCACPPEHQGSDQSNATGCQPPANCMLQCLSVPPSIVPAGHTVAVRYATTVPLSTRMEGRLSSANFPPFRPPTV